jgi:ribosome-associated toxin RatA of RatAB toxin-antitoxin module
MISVTDSIVIHGPLQTVFAHCWNAEQWPEITPHVKSVRLLEQTPVFQRMAMTVESDGKLFNTESTRQCAPPQKIEYQQLTPPPFLSHHSGEWRFHGENDGTRVELTHRFVADEELARRILSLGPEQNVGAYIGERLKRNGLLTLRAIKQLVESVTPMAEVAIAR